MHFMMKKQDRDMNTMYTSPSVELVSLDLETGILGFSQGSEIITPMDIDIIEYEEIL